MVKGVCPELPSEKALRERWKRSSRERARLRAAAESAVVRWQWATGPVFDLLPFDPEISGLSRGRLLPEEPRDKEGCLEYGLDEDCRPRVIRRYVRLPGKYYLELFAYAGDAFESVHYDYDPSEKMATGVAAGCFGPDGLVSHRSFASGTSRTSHYDYAEGRVSGLSVQEGKEKRQFVVERNPDGVVLAIRERGLEGRAAIRYERPTMSLDELVVSLRALLAREIPRVVAASPTRSRAYCLGLGYDSSSYASLPPQMALGEEAYRAATFDPSDVDRNRRRLFQVMQFESFGSFVFADPEIKRQSSMANQHFQIVGSTAASRDMLVSLAQELNALAWSEILPVTDDFVVYAVDIDNTKVAEDLEASIPPEKLAVLRAASYL